MWEFEITNKSETKIIFGYSYSSACKEYGINQNEWELLRSDYID